MRAGRLRPLGALLVGLAALASSRSPGASKADLSSGAPASLSAGAPTSLSAGASIAWLNPAWSHRVSIAVHPDSIEGTGDLSQLPVLLTLGAGQTDVFQGARPDGMDLVVTAGDGVTVLDHEVVRFDPVAKSAEIWFEASPLSRTENTFFLYYGNPIQATGPAAGAAWNPRYVAVYHFQENPGLGVLRDYGSRANHASSASLDAFWTSSDVTSGQIGQAWNLNGVTHYIDADAISTPDTSFVISTWLKVPSRTTDFTFQANPGFWHISAQINETHRRPHYGAANPWRDLRWGPNPLPDDGLYHYYTWVFDGEADTILFYFDGLKQPATPWSIDPGVEHFYTGHPINPNHLTVSGAGVAGPMHWNALDLMNGPADEFRVSERTHTSEWIRTEYRNQRNPQGFYLIGPEETNGTVSVRLLSLGTERVGTHGVIRWTVADGEDDLAGFHVYREEASGLRIRLTPALLQGEHEYVFIDEEAPSEAAAYWLAEHSRLGEVTWHGPAVLEPAVPPRRLLTAVPNPVPSSTSVRFRTEKPGFLVLRVFDLRGREVTRLLEGWRPAGDHQVPWDGNDDQGARVRAGLYLLRLDHAGGPTTGKLVLLP